MLISNMLEQNMSKKKGGGKEIGETTTGKVNQNKVKGE